MLADEKPIAIHGHSLWDEPLGLNGFHASPPNLLGVAAKLFSRSGHGRRHLAGHRRWLGRSTGEPTGRRGGYHAHRQIVNLRDAQAGKCDGHLHVGVGPSTVHNSSSGTRATPLISMACPAATRTALERTQTGDVGITGTGLKLLSGTASNSKQ